MYNLCPEDADYSAVVPKTTRWRRSRNDETREANINLTSDNEVELENTNVDMVEHGPSENQLNDYKMSQHTDSSILQDYTAAGILILVT